MLRFSILILSIFSLLYGVYFLFFPYNFATLTNAEDTNIAWLRNIGGAITGLLFFGLLFIFIEPNKSIKLLKVIIITSVLQTTALIYSRTFGEFSANKMLIIDLTIYSALIVTVYLIFISIKFKKI
ncbi:hypothetical protein OAZ22_02085, partial [Pelagibacteraceae bacterium]|nr:hypothetical protein [Pelagibacteraceae bacterium]